MGLYLMAKGEKAIGILLSRLQEREIMAEKQALDNTLKLWDHVAMHDCTQSKALKYLGLTRDDCGELLCEYSLITRIDVCNDCILPMIDGMCSIKEWSFNSCRKTAMAVAEDVLDCMNDLYPEEDYD